MYITLHVTRWTSASRKTIHYATSVTSCAEWSDNHNHNDDIDVSRRSIILPMLDNSPNPERLTIWLL